MFSCGVLVLALFVYCKESTLAKPIADVETVQDVLNEDFEEYESVHGRILAVNMATLGKRRLQLRPRSQNPFGNIEKVNEGKHLNLYQGDIQLDEDLERYLHMPVRSMNKRNAIRSKKRIWSSKVIPYKIPAFMSHIKQNLMTAIAEFHKYTCLQFIPYRPGIDKNYITFDKDSGCSSRVGKKYFKAGAQTISLGNGCNNVGTIQHEIMHAIGFFHEQSRSDRDKYVTIHWENILKGFSDQFDKYTWITLDNLGKSYDYESIMHYDRMAFTKNGQPTIVAVGNAQMDFNKKNRLSAGDAIEINTLYDCRVQSYGWSRWTGFTPCNDKCYKTRERFCYNPGNVKYCGGNTNAYGIEKQEVKCTKEECDGQFAIDGNWGLWSKWTKCTATCDNGVRERYRKCDNPVPGKYGKPCAGSASEKNICTVARCHKDYDDTDFEDPFNPFGMWKNKPGSDIYWKRNKDFTQTIHTGPMRDHTTGSGYYLYMESSTPAQSNYKAILTSPSMTPKQGGQCLKFAYSMYGGTMGSLEVKLRYNALQASLFYKSGDQGDLWHSTSISLNFPTMPGYKLEIIATVGHTGYSDIAIDDVYIDDGLCSCQDKYIACVNWAINGECDKNKIWMSSYCKRSCKICGNDQTSVASPAPTPKPTPNQDCKDTDPVQCPLWANIGECSKNTVYMHKNCARSCKICQGETCYDNNTSCKGWADIGECTKNPAYMKVMCKKSCGVCH